jgi:hypothetical protein
MEATFFFISIDFRYLSMMIFPFINIGVVYIIMIMNNFMLIMRMLTFTPLARTS